MNKTLEHWISLSTDELDVIYSQSSAGSLPTGDMRGTAIVTGSMLPRTLARFARLFAWQGKVFDIFADNGNSGLLINKVTPWSLNFIVAKVYRDKSWLDGKETIVIDYGSTSFFAQLIRDEIREIEPGLYLGKVWWRKTRILDFALAAPQQQQNNGNSVKNSEDTHAIDNRANAGTESTEDENTSKEPRKPETMAERKKYSIVDRLSSAMPNLLNNTTQH